MPIADHLKKYITAFREHGHPNITIPAAGALAALALAPYLRKLAQRKVGRYQIPKWVDLVPAVGAWSAGRMVQGLPILPMTKSSSVRDIGLMTSFEMIENDPTLGIVDRINAKNFLLDASGGKKTGLIGSGDITRAAVNAGLGGTAAYMTGKALGSFFGMSPKAQRTLTAVGVLGGLLKGTILSDSKEPTSIFGSTF